MHYGYEGQLSQRRRLQVNLLMSQLQSPLRCGESPCAAGLNLRRNILSTASKVADFLTHREEPGTAASGPLAQRSERATQNRPVTGSNQAGATMPI